MAPAIFKPEKNLVFFFQDKIAGAIDAYPGKLILVCSSPSLLWANPASLPSQVVQVAS